jgi:hypothetical protein
MASNTIVAFFWRAKINGTIAELAWEYWKVTVPVSVLVGPLGAFIGSYVHRQTLAWTVYILEFIALVGGFFIVKPSLMLSITCVFIIVGGFAFFYCLSRWGTYLLTTYDDSQNNPIPSVVAVRKNGSNGAPPSQQPPNNVI